MKIRYKFVLVIGISLLISIVFSGIIFYLIARQSIEERTKAQLESVAVIKENQINDFIEERINDTEILMHEKYFTSNYLRMVKSVRKSEEIIYHKEIEYFFKERIDHNNIFHEIFIINDLGKITISTDEIQEGKIKTNEEYYTQGREGLYIQNFYFDVDIMQPSMIISSPINDMDGTLIGVLAGRINLNKIADVMAERSGLGKTGETYLINQYNLLVSKSRFIEGIEFKKIIHTEGVIKNINGITKPHYYKDYRDVEVLGTSRWLPERELYLLVEIDKEEALQPINRLKYLILLIGSVSIILSVIAGFFLTLSITKPLIKLRDATRIIGSGDLDYNIKVHSKDEVGELAKSFNQMVTDLKETTVSRDLLLREVEERRKAEMHLAQQTTELVMQHEKLKKQNKQIEEQAEILNQANTQLEERQQYIEEQSEKLNIINRNLEDMNVTKDKLFSIIAHDLKNPFNTLLGFSDILVTKFDDMDEAKRKKIIHIINSSGKKIYTLLENLLQWSRTQTRKISYNPEKINFNQIVEENRHIIDNMLRQKKLEFLAEIPENLFINADPDMINTILRNLLTNSVKFTKEGRIVVRAKKQGQLVLIEVSDTGTGMSKEEISGLFIVANSKSKSGTNGEQGSGLGLIICKEFIEIHGGKLNVTSEVGKGSVFGFTIPVGKD